MFLVEKLRVYNKALLFSKDVVKLGITKPAPQFRPLYDQLLRASSSIALNIAEGNGRWGIKERKQFFRIARGSCHECVPLLELIEVSGMIDKGKHKQLHEELTVISKMINALIFGANRKSKSGDQTPRAY